MAYALIFCRRIYKEIIYHLYDLRLNKQEYATASKLFELLHTHSFINIELRPNYKDYQNIINAEDRLQAMVQGLESYHRFVNQDIYTCIRVRDGQFYCLDSSGNLDKLTSAEYMELKRPDKARYMNLEIKNNKLKANLYTIKTKKFNKENTQLLVRTCYLAFTEDDECLVLANSCYCTFYGTEIKNYKIAQKLFVSRGIEIEYDGICEYNNFMCYLLDTDNLNAKILLQDKDLLDYIYKYLKSNYQDLTQYDEFNRIYCLVLDLDTKLKNKLKLIIKNS